MSHGPRISIAIAPQKTRSIKNADERLIEAAAQLNERFQQSLSSPAEVGESAITLVLADATAAFDALVCAAEACWPMPVRSVVRSVGHGVGPAADNHARTRALNLMIEAERDRAPFRFIIADRKDGEMRLAEAAALLHSALMAEWTQTRADAVRAYRRLGRQLDVAEALGITQQAVSQMLRGARLRELNELEESMRGWFETEARPGLWPLRKFEKGPALAAQA